MEAPIQTAGRRATLWRQTTGSEISDGTSQWQYCIHRSRHKLLTANLLFANVNPGDCRTIDNGHRLVPVRTPGFSDRELRRLPHGNEIET